MLPRSRPSTPATSPPPLTHRRRCYWDLGRRDLALPSRPARYANLCEFSRPSYLRPSPGAPFVPVIQKILTDVNELPPTGTKPENNSRPAPRKNVCIIQKLYQVFGVRNPNHCSRRQTGCSSEGLPHSHRQFSGCAPEACTHSHA